jgi:2-polyprenyl-6-methoxyphenol hydroxylase-like FAD-dependent oxidoreductase
MKAIVIGSGIAGLSAAIALRKAGLQVVLYERAPVLTEVGAGISLWANALRALDTIGAGAAVRERLQPLRVSEFRGDEGRTIAASFPASTLEAALGYQPVLGMIHRAELVDALANYLPPDTARYGFDVTAVRDTGTHVEVTFANGHRDEADLVIGADGIHSKIRALLGDASPPRYAGYTCVRGITAMPSGLEPGYLAEWWGRGSRVGITTLRDRRVYWWATINASPNQRIDDMRAWLSERFGGWADPVPELMATTPDGAFLQNDIVDRPPTRNWYRGRCLLIGDAAHPTTPNLGQGGCIAIEDAACLWQLFAQSMPLDEILPAFVTRRYARTTAINRDSHRLGRIGQWSGRTACWWRDAITRRILPVIGVQELLKHARHVE